MRSAYSINATYGSGKTPCTVYVLEHKGGYWYAVEDSCNVNFSYTEPTNGCDVEEIQDSDTFTWPDGVKDEDELEKAVDA